MHLVFFLAIIPKCKLVFGFITTIPTFMDHSYFISNITVLTVFFTLVKSQIDVAKHKIEQTERQNVWLSNPLLPHLPLYIVVTQTSNMSFICP